MKVKSGREAVKQDLLGGGARVKVKFGISLAEDLASWAADAAASWNMSRSAVVEQGVRTLRQVIEGLVVVTETREARALAAIVSLNHGEVPPMVDLQALAEVAHEPEEAPP